MFTFGLSIFSFLIHTFDFFPTPFIYKRIFEIPASCDQVLIDPLLIKVKIKRTSNVIDLAIKLELYYNGSPFRNRSFLVQRLRDLVLKCCVFSVAEPTLSIAKVRKEDAGAYLCIASNGIPPRKSKRFLLTVLCKLFNFIKI